MKKNYMIIIILAFCLISSSVYAENYFDDVFGTENFEALEYVGEWTVEKFCIKAEGRCIDKDSIASSSVQQIYSDGVIQFLTSNGSAGELSWCFNEGVFLVKDPEFGDYSLVLSENNNLVQEDNEYKILFYQEKPFEIDVQKIDVNARLKDYGGTWTLTGVGSGNTFRDAVYFRLKGAVEILEDGKLNIIINEKNRKDVSYTLNGSKIEVIFSDDESDTIHPTELSLLSGGKLLLSVVREDKPSFSLIFERKTVRTELE